MVALRAIARNASDFSLQLDLGTQNSSSYSLCGHFESSGSPHNLGVENGSDRRGRLPRCCERAPPGTFRQRLSTPNNAAGFGHQVLAQETASFDAADTSRLILRWVFAERNFCVFS